MYQCIFNTIDVSCYVVVGIDTRYGLEGLGIDSQWGARFPAPGQTGPGSQPVPCTVGAEVKERVELYFCSTCDPSWSVLG